MKTIVQFAKDRKVSKWTVYSWIARKEQKKNHFKVIQIGNTKLIIDTRKPK